MAEIMVRYDDLRRYCEKRHCGSVPIEYIKQMPTIEAEPVLHAKWVNDTFCSNCNRFPVYQGMPISNQELTKHFSRCPHCGARMDADKIAELRAAADDYAEY